jgi:hypothetical protein
LKPRSGFNMPAQGSNAKTPQFRAFAGQIRLAQRKIATYIRRITVASVTTSSEIPLGAAKECLSGFRQLASRRE